MKLKQFVNGLPMKGFLANQDAMESKHDFDLLAEIMPDVFPRGIAVKLQVERLPQQDPKTRPNNVYTEDYLPYHVHDDAWLTNYVSAVAKSKHPKRMIGRDNIQDYVQHSGIFYACRSRYESELFRAQIQYMLHKPMPNGLMTDATPYQNRHALDYDKTFRQALQTALAQTGLSQHMVEVRIEENADVWRKAVMKQAFENHFYPHPYPELIETHKEFDPWWGEMAKIKQAHQDVWLQCREYNYYFEHKDVIDHTNTATAAMQLNQQDAFNLFAENSRYTALRDNLFADGNEVNRSANVTQEQNPRTL